MSGPFCLLRPIRFAMLVPSLVGCGSADDQGKGGAGGGNLPASTAGEGSTSDLPPDARAFVDAHNAIRAAVTEPGNYQGTWEPIPPVTWSNEVAESAQAWANHLKGSNCALDHDGSSPYGENLAWGNGGLTPDQAVAMWSQEGESYTYPGSYSPGTGHYTQIVWRNTLQIGCGQSTCNDGSSVVCCRYDPPGNMMGQAPY